VLLQSSAPSPHRVQCVSTTPGGGTRRRAALVKKVPRRVRESAQDAARQRPETLVAQRDASSTMATYAPQGPQAGASAPGRPGPGQLRSAGDFAFARAAAPRELLPSVG